MSDTSQQIETDNSGSERSLEPASFETRTSGDQHHLIFSGNWTIAGIAEVDAPLSNAVSKLSGQIIIDTSGVTNFDTAGAWLVERSRIQCEEQGGEFTHQDEEYSRRRIVEVIREEAATVVPIAADAKPSLGMLGNFGGFVYNGFQDFLTACYLIGAAVRRSQMKTGRRGNFRIKSVINQIDHMGLRAIPVIGVMSFLIGAIIAQQGAYQLKFYGEELLTVQLVSILHFREIGVLLTAVMVAGRTGSAITAEIGSMKMREEVDALQVMGLNPVGVLVFPRLIALIIILPILTLLSDIFGILGAIFVSALYIDIAPAQFLTTLQSISTTHLMVGLIKAPFMAVVIALAASVEGLKVAGSAESLGRGTTTAVVRSIFAVILLDGIFAMFFAALGY